MTDAGSENGRTSFQELLDRRFPRGGFAATFFERGSRLEPTGREVTTGRIVCSGARRDASGRWRYEITMDPRREPEEEVEPLVAWIGQLAPHPSIPHLWEAQASTDDGEMLLLRLNAEPRPPWRPTRRMRDAVTAAHRDVLAGDV